MSERWWLLLSVAVVLGLGGLARLRARPSQPIRHDHLSAEAWMVDTLPDIGSKRLAASLTAIHHGTIDTLPKAARPMAEQIFIFAPTPE